MRPWVWLALASLGGCQSAPDIPATLANPGPEAHASIARALKQATGRDVVLDHTAFTVQSALYLTPRERRQVDQAPRLGRVMVEPIRFDLALRGRRCVLIDRRNATAYPLDDVQCVAVAG